MMKSSNGVWVTVSLVVLIGLCGAMVPWKDLGRPSKTAVKEDLRERFERYRALRMQNDWDALYDMTLPTQRERVDKRTFLQFYGHGMLKPLSIELLDLGFNERLNTGATKIAMEHELVRENLPPSARNVRVDSPEDLRKKGTIDIEWARVGGQWYFLMEQEVVSGQAGGRAISPGLSSVK